MIFWIEYKWITKLTNSKLFDNYPTNWHTYLQFFMFSTTENFSYCSCLLHGICTQNVTIFLIHLIVCLYLLFLISKKIILLKIPSTCSIFWCLPIFLLLMIGNAKWIMNSKLCSVSSTLHAHRVAFCWMFISFSVTWFLRACAYRKIKQFMLGHPGISIFGNGLKRSYNFMFDIWMAPGCENNNFVITETYIVVIPW